MISFKRLDIRDLPRDEMSNLNGGNLSHTLPYINFLANYQGAEPVIAAVQSDGKTHGYFSGFIKRKYGLKILGSPLRVWDVYFLGFNLLPGVSSREVLQAFPKFAFDELKCDYLEIVDANLTGDEWKGLSYHVEKFTSYSIDLTKSEEELFANLEGDSCRRSIRRAIKKGVVVEQTTDPGFADEYYAQHQEVFAKQSLVPVYGLDYVRQLITHLLPTGNLLLLRAKNPEGVCIATIINFIFGKVGVGWGTASWQQYHYLNPNELIYWESMKRLKAMGVEELHVGGGKRFFKSKFGCCESKVFRLWKARNPLLNIPLSVVTAIKNDRVRFWMRRVLGK